jgi:23S rRNA pseudouridine1911/1915/1917 synthase
METNAPYIIEETNDFAVVFKPSKMHSVPLKQKTGGSLFEWYAAHSPSVYDLVHRLDFETHGLVLFAKNLESYKFFKSLQDGGEFVKEYSALCASSAPQENPGPGFPPSPILSADGPSLEKPLIIMSFFRPFGPGRQQVRPVTDGKRRGELARDNGGFYRTEITGINGNVFNLRIKRGFRHQIRCHLCWIGHPIQNDPLYSQQANERSDASIALDTGRLALRAHALFFTDPSNGRRCGYRIDQLMLEKDGV